MFGPAHEEKTSCGSTSPCQYESPHGLYKGAASFPNAGQEIAICECGSWQQTYQADVQQQPVDTQGT